MPNNAVNSISAMHRRFTSPDEWRSMIEPHFAGSRYTRRAHSFSVWGRLERLGDALLIDNYVAASGLGTCQRHVRIFDRSDRDGKLLYSAATSRISVREAV